MRVLEGTVTVDDLDETLSTFDAVSERTGATVQAFDARYVVDRTHLERAVELADRAFERGENIARDRAVEVLLYAAGRRQIRRALEMGLSEGETDQPAVLVVDGGDEESAARALSDLLTPAETLGRPDEGLVRDFFDVTDAEVATVDGTLADLVHERVALLVVDR